MDILWQQGAHASSSHLMSWHNCIVCTTRFQHWQWVLTT
jgi:hypothetical protein